MNASSFSNCSRIASTQRGFTLVELMVAMTIGLFISAGVISLFVETKQSYRANDGMARVQENGRFAIEYLSRDVRQAGFRDIFGTIPPTWPATDSIQGWPGANTAPSAASLTSYTANTDVFRIQYDVPTPNSLVTHTNTYYIAPGTSGEPGLQQRRVRVVTTATTTATTTTTAELVEGVYDMQIRYGLDTNGDSQLDSYASTVTNWSQVVAVRIDLLLGSSENNLAEASMSLPFERNDGTFFTATDRRIYQMFSTTIALRNRLP